ICIRAARSIIEKVDNAVRGAKLANEGKAGTCTIYVSQWCVWTGFTGKVLAHTARLDPGIEVIIRDGHIGTQWHCLRKGHVDLSIATEPPEGFEDLKSEVLLNDVVSLAVLPPNHPLAKRASVRLEELADETLLTYEPKLLSTIDRDVRSEFE